MKSSTKPDKQSKGILLLVVAFLLLSGYLDLQRGDMSILVIASLAVAGGIVLLSLKDKLTK